MEGGAQLGFPFEVKVKGGPGLKASQAYPDLFGQKVAETFLRHRGPLRQHPEYHSTFVRAHSLLKLTGGEDLWQDADLKPVMDYLMKD